MNQKGKYVEPNEKLSKRLTALESSMMHLQNDYDSLNEAVLENTRRLEKLVVMLERLTQRVDAASADGSTPRNAEDEKPPHY